MYITAGNFAQGIGQKKPLFTSHNHWMGGGGVNLPLNTMEFFWAGGPLSTCLYLREAAKDVFFFYWPGH